MFLNRNLVVVKKRIINKREDISKMYNLREMSVVQVLKYEGDDNLVFYNSERDISQNRKTRIKKFEALCEKIILKNFKNYTRGNRFIVRSPPANSQWGKSLEYD